MDKNDLTMASNDREAPLSRLVQEAELQHLLTDEKLRSEQHKLNFQSLKIEHDRLQDEHKKLQMSVKQLTEENYHTKESYKTMLQHYKKELVQKQSELEEAKKDVVTPQQLSLMRMNLQEELEKCYRERVAMVEEEAERYHNTSNKLRYDLMFLRTEYQRAEQEHCRVLEETTLKLKAEVDRLNQERTNLQNALEAQKTNQTTSMVKKLQQDNLELNHRLKLLQEAMDEAQARKEHSVSQTNSLQNLQVKQLAEHAAKVRGLELEKESLNVQLESIQSELKKSMSIYEDQALELKSAQQKTKEYQMKLQEVEYRSRIDVADVQMKMLKQKGEVEQERDQLAIQLCSVKNDLESTQQQLSQQMQAMENAEKEAFQRLHALRDEEWTKLNGLEAEKLQLESRIEELEQMQMDCQFQHKSALSTLNDKLMSAVRDKETLQAELQRLRVKQEGLEPRFEELQKRKEAIELLQRDARNFQDEKNRIENALKREREENENAKKAMNDLRAEANKYQNENLRQTSLHDAMLLQQQLNWEETKRQFHTRISTLENQLMQARQKHDSESLNTKTRMKKYQQMTLKLRDRTRLLKAKVEELELEKQILKKNVPQEVHRLLQKQLRDLKRKLSNFHVVLTNDASAVSLPNVASENVCFRSQKATSAIDLTNETERNIEEVKNRMKVLDRKQRRQLLALETDNNGHTADDEDSNDSAAKYDDDESK